MDGDNPLYCIGEYNPKESSTRAFEQCLKSHFATCPGRVAFSATHLPTPWPQGLCKSLRSRGKAAMRAVRHDVQGFLGTLGRAIETWRVGAFWVANS